MGGGEGRGALPSPHATVRDTQATPLSLEWAKRGGGLSFLYLHILHGVGGCIPFFHPTGFSPRVHLPTRFPLPTIPPRRPIASPLDPLQEAKDHAAGRPSEDRWSPLPCAFRFLLFVLLLILCRFRQQ